MPDKAGKLTRMERVFVERFAATGDATYAAEKAGYAHPASRGSQNLAKPALVEKIQKRVERELQEEVLPVAVARHKMILLDPLAPAGAVVMAIKLAYDRGLRDDPGNEKDLADMSAEELQVQIRKANHALNSIADKARVIEPEPVQSAQAAPNLFD